MKRIIFFVIPLILISCSGSHSSSDPWYGTPPIITNVVLTDEWGVPASIFYIGDKANIYVWATDPDLDIETGRAWQYLDNGETPYYGPDEGQLPSQSNPDVIITFIEAMVIEGPAGNWRIELQITDARGNDSNIFKVFAVVYD